MVGVIGKALITLLLNVYGFEVTVDFGGAAAKRPKGRKGYCDGLDDQPQSSA
jgi:hypothetical protein